MKREYSARLLDKVFKDAEKAERLETENKTLRDLVTAIKKIIDNSEIASHASCLMIEDEIDDYFTGKDKKNEGSEDGD